LALAAVGELLIAEVSHWCRGDLSPEVNIRECWFPLILFKTPWGRRRHDRQRNGNDREQAAQALALDRAREVRQLVNGLNGEPARPGKRRCAAEFHRYLLFGIAS
jgi:hypothetical protein